MSYALVRDRGVRLIDRAPSELSADDETQFLNYILTKFANSQPEVQ